MRKFHALFVFCLLPTSAHFFEFITSRFNSGVEYFQCNYECCSPNYQWIKPNFDKLKQELEKKVHGQHLVQEVLMKALKSHYKDTSPKKALVISLHGDTGTGKNFVSDFVAAALYQKGSKSKYVSKFIQSVDFQHESKVDSYKSELKDKISEQVASCERSLFVFDEVHKFPQGLLDAIKPFIDYHTEIEGVNFRKSIFLFLSNTGIKEILKFSLNWFGEGKIREDISLSDVEPLIQNGAFNEPGGYHMSELIEGSLVDYYVPFFPLERRHVELCARDELKRLGYVNADIVKKVADDVVYRPIDNPLFASKGCRHVIQRVKYFLPSDEL